MAKIRSIPMVFAVNRFATDISAARQEIGLNGDEVAKMLPFDKSSLYKYERGEQENMHIQNFISLCNLYDLDPRDYFELKA